MKRIITVLTAAALLLTPGFSGAPTHAAAPAMPALGTGIDGLTFHLSGTFSASAVGVVSFRAPTDLQVLYVTVVNQAKGGTQGVSTLGCLNAGTLFTNAVDLTGTAGAILEATLVAAQQSIAKDATVTCDLTITGGTAPTISNITVVIWIQRRS